MKKIILLFLVLTAVCSIKSYATISVREATSSQYLMNHGYSTESAIITQKIKAEVSGKRYPDPRRKSLWFPFNFIRGLYEYIEPGSDNRTFMDHDIKYIPGYYDL